MHDVDQGKGERDRCMLQQCFSITLWSNASPSQYLKRQYGSPSRNAGACKRRCCIHCRASRQCGFNSAFDVCSSLSSAHTKDLALKVCCGATVEAHRGGMRFAESLCAPNKICSGIREAPFGRSGSSQKEISPVVSIKTK